MRMSPKDHEKIAHDLLADMDARITVQNPSDVATAQVNIVGIMAAELVRFARECDKGLGGGHIEQQYKDGLKKHINKA